MIEFLIGFVLSTAIAFLAYSNRTLSDSGFIAALVVGIIIYGFIGPYAYLVLMVFFITSSLINIFDKDKEPAYRSALQVFANAGFATAFALLYAQFNDTLYYVLFLASIGVAASDTWSSEFGRKSKKEPFHIFKLKRMTKGLSGGVSLKGLGASILASVVFGLLTLAVLDLRYAVLVAIASFLGSIIDSMLGVIQVKYFDEERNIITEKKTSTTRYHSGLVFINNHVVNFLANGITIGLLALYIFLY